MVADAANRNPNTLINTPGLRLENTSQIQDGNMTKLTEGTIYKCTTLRPYLEGGAQAYKHENRTTVSQAIEGKNPFRYQIIVNRLPEAV